MANEFEVILCIVNNGFSEHTMEAAKKVGARGGTVLREVPHLKMQKKYSILRFILIKNW